MQRIINVLSKLVLYALPKGEVYCCSMAILTFGEYNKQVQKNRSGEHHASNHIIRTTKWFAAMLSTRQKTIIIGPY